MRRFERIISLLAVIGVLLHAGLLVRHNGVMLDAAMDRIALAFAGGIICHGGEDAQPGSGLPSPSGKLPNCPVCVSVAASVAILPPLVILLGKSQTSSLHTAVVDQQIDRRADDIRPPSRAPPRVI